MWSISLKSTIKSSKPNLLKTSLIPKVLLIKAGVPVAMASKGT